MGDHYKHTIETWGKLAAIYDEKFSEIRLYDDSYQAFISALDHDDASILEIGCGPGTVTHWLKNHHPTARILATDAAPEMIEFARNKLPEIEFSILDARDLHSIQDKYDGIFSGFCVPYLNKDDLHQFLTTATTKLNKNGVLYVSFIQGDYKNSTVQKGSTGDSMKVHYYREEDLSTTLKANRMSILERIQVNYALTDGTEQIHAIILARKN